MDAILISLKPSKCSLYASILFSIDGVNVNTSIMNIHDNSVVEQAVLCKDVSLLIYIFEQQIQKCKRYDNTMNNNGQSRRSKQQQQTRKEEGTTMADQEGGENSNGEQ